MSGSTGTPMLQPGPQSMPQGGAGGAPQPGQMPPQQQPQSPQQQAQMQNAAKMQQSAAGANPTTPKPPMAPPGMPGGQAPQPPPQLLAHAMQPPPAAMGVPAAPPGGLPGRNVTPQIGANQDAFAKAAMMKNGPGNAQQPLHPSQQRMTPAEMAQKGRYGDKIVAHVTPGEISVPPEVQTPELRQALAHAFAAKRVSIDQFTAGNPRASINPNTGAPELSYLAAILGEAGNLVGGYYGGPVGAVAGAASSSAVGDWISGTDTDQTAEDAGVAGAGALIGQGWEGGAASTGADAASGAATSTAAGAGSAAGSAAADGSIDAADEAGTMGTGAAATGTGAAVSGAGAEGAEIGSSAAAAASTAPPSMTANSVGGIAGQTGNGTLPTATQTANAQQFAQAGGLTAPNNAQPITGSPSGPTVSPQQSQAATAAILRGNPGATGSIIGGSDAGADYGAQSAQQAALNAPTGPAAGNQPILNTAGTTPGTAPTAPTSMGPGPSNLGAPVQGAGQGQTLQQYQNAAIQAQGGKVPTLNQNGASPVVAGSNDTAFNSATQGATVQPSAAQTNALVGATPNTAAQQGTAATGGVSMSGPTAGSNDFSLSNVGSKVGNWFVNNPGEALKLGVSGAAGLGALLASRSGSKAPPLPAGYSTHMPATNPNYQQLLHNNTPGAQSTPQFAGYNPQATVTGNKGYNFYNPQANEANGIPGS